MLSLLLIIEVTTIHFKELQENIPQKELLRELERPTSR
jgi:hypothetical protein